MLIAVNLTFHPITPVFKVETFAKGSFVSWLGVKALTKDSAWMCGINKKKPVYSTFLVIPLKDNSLSHSCVTNYGCQTGLNINFTRFDKALRDIP